MVRAKPSPHKDAELESLRHQVHELKSEQVRLRRIEQELQQRQEIYHFLYEETQAANVIIAPDGTILDVNRGFAKSLGYSKNAVIGRKMDKFIVPEHRRIARKTLKESFADKGAGPLELDLTGKDAVRTIWWTSGRAPVVKVGGRKGVLASGVDITDRKRAEQQLRDSEQRYRTVIDGMGDPIHVVDRALRITLFNATFARWCKDMGLQADAIGRSLFDVFPFLPRRVRDEYRRVFDTGQALVGEEVLNVGDRRIITETRKVAVREGKRVAGVITVVRDITARKRAQEGLVLAHRRLMTARDEERKRLARELHDSVGQGLVAMQLDIEKVFELCSKTCENASRLGPVAQRCSRMVQEIRNICHGLYPPTLEPLGLVAALKQVLQQCKGHVRVRTRFASSVRQVRFDPQIEIALFRIAQEALCNVLQHSRARSVALGLGSMAGRVTMTIQDDGAGFEPDEAAGRGIGLASMKERAEALGGTLRIVSGPGRTRVEARLPVRPRAIPGSPTF